MPTIDGIPGPHRFFFYSLDCAEPMHVHVRRDACECKFWLEPVALADNHGFASRELATIKRTILEKREGIVEAWHEHCRTKTG